MEINTEVLEDGEEPGVEVEDLGESLEAENPVENCEISLPALNGTKGYRTQGFSK